MVYSTDRSKAVVPVLVLLFVALWFILRGDLLYVFPCVILFLCFSVLLVLRLPRLGKRELILVLFVRLFDLCLFGFVGFLLLLGSGKGCGLWLWHTLDFSLTFFICYLELNKPCSAGKVIQRYSTYKLMTNLDTGLQTCSQIRKLFSKRCSPCNLITIVKAVTEWAIWMSLTNYVCTSMGKFSCRDRPVKMFHLHNITNQNWPKLCQNFTKYNDVSISSAFLETVFKAAIYGHDNNLGHYFQNFSRSLNILSNKLSCQTNWTWSFNKFIQEAYNVIPTILTAGSQQQ